MRKNQGMAIPVVLGFIGLMSIAAVMLLQVNRQDLPRSFVNLKHLQMKYLAKGAQQHARLKMKLLSTQAYDAAAYSVGKNPFFDHSAGYDHLLMGNGTLGQFSVSNEPVVTNPGPAFFTGTVEIAGGLKRTDVSDVYDASAESWSTGGPPNGVGTDDISLFRHTPDPDAPTEMPALKRVNLALVRFWEDISTLDLNSPTWDPIYVHSQPAIRINQEVDPVTGMADRFDASYRVSDMRVLAGRGNRLYGEEAVQVKVWVQLRRRSMTGESTPAAGAATNANLTQRVGSAAIGGTVTGDYRETAVYKVARTLD